MAYNIDAALHVLHNGAERVTSPFGNRTIYINGAYNTNFHSGTDVVQRSTGTDYIVAAARGYVTATRNTIEGFSEVYSSGNYVKLEHADGYTTEYLHMAKGSVAVSVGDVVEKGQVLGYMGTTGWSTGNHLHFGIRINGSTVNPEPYLLGQKSLPDYDGNASVLGEGMVLLNNTPLYISSTAAAPSNRLSGVYYIWGTSLINGRYRITNKPENIGKTGQVTGWVNASEITVDEDDTVTQTTEEQSGSHEPEKEDYEKRIAGLTGQLELAMSAITQ